MNKILFKRSLLLFFTGIFSFFLIQQSLGQNMQNDTVVIVKSYQPTISDAFKINDNPKIIDTVVERLNLNYTINPQVFPTTFDVNPIKAVKMVGEPLTKLYNGLVKAGFGTNVTPLGEFYYGTGRSKDHSIGVSFNHLSSSGEIKGYGYPGFSDNNADVYARRIYKHCTLSADVEYNRNLVHFYGFKPLPNEAINKDSIKQCYNKVGGQIRLNSTFPDSGKINHEVKFAYYHFSDSYNATEDFIGLNAALDKKVKLLGKSVSKQFAGINADVDFFNDLNKADTSNGAVIKLVPHYSASFDIMKLDVGINTSIKAANSSNVFFYPDVKISVDLYKNDFILYCGANGDYKKNNLMELTVENPFLNTGVFLQYSNTKSNYYGGIKGSISSCFSFNANISQSNITNLPLFFNDTTFNKLNRFTIIYADAKLFKTHVELSYQKNEKIKAMLISNYYQYTMLSETESKAWQRPDMDLTFMMSYNLKNKIIMKAEIFAMGKSYAKLYDTANVMSIKTLKGIVDVNLGVEYRYTKVLSAFININNVAAIKYQRWYNYPAYRFNIIGGITYAFGK